MSGKGAGVVVADHSTYKLVEPTTRIVAGTRTTSFKRPQEESGPHEGAAGTIRPQRRVFNA
jgi:hypothetical protein